MVEAYQYRTYTAHTYSADIVQILRIPSLQNEVLRARSLLRPHPHVLAAYM